MRPFQPSVYGSAAMAFVAVISRARREVLTPLQRFHVPTSAPLPQC